MSGRELQEIMLGRLLFALETTRMRLSVAAAMEAKSTPRDRLRYYMDTAERAGRLARRLRRRMDLGSEDGLGSCEKALHALHAIPAQVKASRLCEILGDIVTQLE